MGGWRPSYEDEIWQRLREVRHQVQVIGAAVVNEADVGVVLEAVDHLEVLTADVKRMIANRRKDGG